jgi:hypothetical protein
MRNRDEIMDEHRAIKRGVDDGAIDPRSQRAQRAMRQVYRSSSMGDAYTDPILERAEAAVASPPQPAYQPPPRPSKPLLNEHQKNIIMEMLFGQAAPVVENVFVAAQTDTGKRVVGIGGLALGSVLLPTLLGARR